MPDKAGKTEKLGKPGKPGKTRKTDKAKRDTPAQVPVDLGSVRYAVKVYTADQIDEMLADLPSGELIEQHIADRDNPHEVTKSQVGLGNVDNTSDADKPLSDADLDALKRKVNVKEPWYLEWTEGDETHSAERAFNNIRVWLMRAFSKMWTIEDNGEGRWRAITDDGQTWVDGVIAESIQDPGSVTFTIDGEDYQFTVVTKSVMVHIVSTDNPHSVTGQQVGVLNSSGKVAAGLVDTGSILNGAVTGVKLKELSIQNSKIANSTITAQKLTTGVQDAIGKNVNASVSVTSPKLVATQAGGIIVNGLDGNWWSIGIDANGDLYKTRVDPPVATTNIADLDEHPDEASSNGEEDGENSNE